MTALNDTRLLTQLYIDGRWLDGALGRTIAVVNPSTGTHLADVAAGTLLDVELAVACAARAFRTWRHTTGAERAVYLRAIAAEVEGRRERLVMLQSLNNGKPQAEAHMDVDDVIATFRYYAQLAEQLDDTSGAEVSIPSIGHRARILREPCGVAALIVPWNFPMVTTAWKLAPALAAGCTVVLKPSEITPLPELELASVIASVGLPAGVFNAVTGTGADVGAPLVGHPGVAKVSFTGSTSVGQTVMKTATDTLKGVSPSSGASRRSSCSTMRTSIWRSTSSKRAAFSTAVRCVRRRAACWWRANLRPHCWRGSSSARSGWSSATRSRLMCRWGRS